MNKGTLEKFFQERPAINKSAFAKEAGISRQYLLMLLSGDRPFTDAVTAKLKEQMKRYGYDV